MTDSGPIRYRSHCANSFSNYLIGPCMVNGFVLGDVGNPHEFWLVGVPAREEDGYPTLTGNFLGADGKPLFMLVKNKLVVNPRNCSRILGKHIGYEIDDGDGNPILRVETNDDGGTPAKLVTRITGNFYNAVGQPVILADERSDNLRTTVTKVALGVGTDDFDVVHGMSPDDRLIAGRMIALGGAVYEVLRGKIENQTISLDGKLLVNAHIKNCELIVWTADFDAVGQILFETCRVKPFGGAKAIADMVLQGMRGQNGNRILE